MINRKNYNFEKTWIVIGKDGLVPLLPSLSMNRPAPSVKGTEVLHARARINH